MHDAGLLASLVRPRSIAIVGASDNSRWSRAAFDNLTQAGFSGALHLVNRRGGTVHGRASVPRCADLPPGVDLGVLLVPAHAAMVALEDLAAAGVRSAVILSSGFAETGSDGADRQQSLGVRAHDLGIRLLGPNTLGFINFVDRTPVWTTPIQTPCSTSGVAIVSQSGATAYFLCELAVRQGVGLSYVVATGNELDLDCSAFLEDFATDSSTRSIALFIESVRDTGRFVRAATLALASGKPVVVLKVGASETIARSALAHTGALVGDDRIFDGICKQLGLIRVRSIEDLLATADIAARTGVLREGGLCIVSNSGGISEIAGETAELRGMVLPQVSANAAEQLRAAMPDFATPHNPLDLTGGVTPEGCGDVVRIMGAEPEVAAVLCPWYEVPIVEHQVNERLMSTYESMAPALNEAPIPGFLVSYTATSLSSLSHRIVADTKLPYLACGLDRAITALAGTFWWSDRFRQQPPPRLQPREESRTANERPRSERATLEYLARRGVPVVPATIARDEAGAIACARAIGGPVVLKIASDAIAHKSDIGGVVLNLSGDAAVGAAFRQIMRAAQVHAPDAVIDGIAVSPMREHGIELFVGYERDVQWGPVLTVGLGGIWVEIMQDAAIRLLPVDAAEVRRMLAELRGAKMLQGQRGVPAADLDAVCKVVARIGDAMASLGPSLAAMDINPLWVRGDRVEALDALPVWDED